jgi:hypothetical protein
MYIKAKLIPIENIPGIKVKENKRELWRSEFKYNIFDTL